MVEIQYCSWACRFGCGTINEIGRYTEYRMQIPLKTIPFFLLLLNNAAKAEERLSWFTKDAEIRSSIFVPDDLPEGKEENRILPWVFHSD